MSIEESTFSHFVSINDTSLGAILPDGTILKVDKPYTHPYDQFRKCWVMTYNGPEPPELEECGPLWAFAGEFERVWASKHDQDLWEVAREHFNVAPPAEISAEEELN